MSKDEDPPHLLTEAQLAEQTGTSVRFWRRLRKRGGGPSYIALTPRTIRYDLRDVTAWLAARRRGPELAKVTSLEAFQGGKGSEQ